MSHWNLDRLTVTRTDINKDLQGGPCPLQVGLYTPLTCSIWTIYRYYIYMYVYIYILCINIYILCMNIYIYIIHVYIYIYIMCIYIYTQLDINIYTYIYNYKTVYIYIHIHITNPRYWSYAYQLSQQCASDVRQARCLWWIRTRTVHPGHNRAFVRLGQAFDLSGQRFIHV